MIRGMCIHDDVLCMLLVNTVIIIFNMSILQYFFLKLDSLWRFKMLHLDSEEMLSLSLRLKC